MIVKCDFCGGYLKFDPELQLMVCEHCCSMFPVEETKEEVQLNNSSENTTDTPSNDQSIKMKPKESISDELMDCSIYECKSCGAQLMLNDVETATYCAYCGQPTIVFERIAKRKRPKYIIPFTISKEEAVVNIREKFIKGEFVPDEIKFFHIDMLRGIYVPFALYDIFYKDRQLLAGNIPDKDGHSGPLQYFYREGKSELKQIPIDASIQFSNESSERLEPFYDRDLMDFKTEYLSGYYADLRDEDFSILKSHAIHRAKDMFDEQMAKSTPAKNAHVIKNYPSFTIEHEDYALYPVWFMVFEQNHKKYTIMVNGQTGKVVGAVPFNKKRLILRFLVVALIISPIACFLFPFFGQIKDFRQYINGITWIGIPTMIGVGMNNIRKYIRCLKLTTESRIRSFVSERQDN